MFHMEAKGITARGKKPMHTAQLDADCSLQDELLRKLFLPVYLLDYIRLLCAS